MLTFIATIFVFLFVVLFHEFGHFIVAKSVGIKVNEFSIGMGPKIFQKEKGETKYSLRLLPIGGYVSMEGEDEASDDPRGFEKVSAPKRIAVVAAGAFMNFLLAIIVFTIVAFSVGVPVTVVANMDEGTPAAESGLAVGDRIVEINGQSVESWDDLTDKISKLPVDESLSLKTSDNKEYSMTPVKAEDGRSVIGIRPATEKNFAGAISSGFKNTAFVLRSMFGFIASIFKGGVERGDVSGPVGIINVIGKAASYGIIPVLNLMGLLSVNLGFINLLPLPALDGSRIVFLLVEIIRGKPVDPEKEGMVHFIGFIALMGLMIFVTYLDISNIRALK